MKSHWFAIQVFVVIISNPNVGFGQEAIFADSFELGHLCRWTSSSASIDCSQAELTLNLPGGVPLTLVRIPAGTFMMGSPDGERGRTTNEDYHQVTLTQDYYIGKTEVTQAQWDAIMDIPMPTSCGSQNIGPDYPVSCVTAGEAGIVIGFAGRLNAYLGTNDYRLPTEAEWERAARAGTQTRFSHGDVLECDDQYEECPTHDRFMWWRGNNVTFKPKLVATKAPNGFGLYDMHGNVREWLQDYYTEHLGTLPVTDPSGGTTITSTVIRSGFFFSYAKHCRSAARGGVAGIDRSREYGFRIAKTAP